MRNIVCFLIIALFVLVIDGPANKALAQDAPQVEVFAGYSYLRDIDNRLNYNGWDASAAVNFNRWFGIAGDLSGQYNHAFAATLSSYTVAVGPRISYREGRVTPFGHVQIGATRLSIGSTSKGYFTTVIGGGLDFKFTNSLAVRLPQLDAVITRGFGRTSWDPRVSAGLVFRFGRK